MTTEAHEVAHRQLDKLIIIKLSQINDLADEICPCGAAHIESGSIKKRADTTYTLRTTMEGATHRTFLSPGTTC
ncbi:hypothetical protein N7530_001629 [Penicillium desertorum]|uniref:Uncharacterized protein n=1 Tax=Penicillium desertorum TaxID=1303715 RepID=A0A9W9XAB6_9EURO|nr:hypothetical protein N7530_001629 [Penicillium desertorum]